MSERIRIQLPTGQETEVDATQLTPSTIQSLVASTGTASFVVRDEEGNLLSPEDFSGEFRTFRRLIIEEYNEAKEV